ncbi:hypothetical protein Y032_0027g1563 [Ancylostoma ceylanicum]|nr:hypothetical protein Y032_0027g1563 [Ancylostoma ceylanicum]
MLNSLPLAKNSTTSELNGTFTAKGNSEMLKISINPPIIAAWTSFFRHALSRPLQPLRSCSFKCLLVNRSELHMYDREASAFIIHGRNLNTSDLPEAHSDQLKILLLMESPNYAGTALAQLPKNYFNASISYRKDSRYFHPYGYFEPITSHSPLGEIISAEQVQEAVRMRSRGCLIFISHCETPSDRGAIIQ